MISAGESVPAELGFRMPAEWHEHRATWVAWPHNQETWPVNLEPAQNEFVRLVETIAREETVCVIASDQALAQASDRLSHLKNIELFDISTNDAWIRDYGPTFVVNETAREIAAVNWRYNGWGEKYPPFEKDIQVASRIAEASGIRIFTTDLVVEGGALEVNDSGEVLTTISCLLNFNRNPPPDVENVQQIDPEQFERFQDDFSQKLAGLCGASSFTWLSGAPIDGDDTDGHIDQQVRYVADDFVLIVKGYGPDDPLNDSYTQIVDDLRHTFSAMGKSLQAADLPMPRPIRMDGKRIPASYLNFYICNYGVIVPQFDDAVADIRAIELLKSVFPDRLVVGLPSLNLACGLGSFHCLTQQEPMV